MFSESLLKHIREKKTALAKSVVSGASITFEDYRYQTGVIHGLDLAIAIVQHLHKAFYEEKIIHREGEEYENL